MATLFSGTLLQKLSGSGGQVEASQAISADAKDERRIAVPIGATDYLEEIAFTVARLKAIMILADQDLTLETNDGGAPDDTIALVAGKPYVWESGSYFANLFTVPVTALYFTNASGVAAEVQILVFNDSTPA